MAEIYTGHVQNGMIVLDSATAPLPEGTKVCTEAVGPTVDGPVSALAEDATAATRAWLLEMAREAKAGVQAHKLPADLAEQHNRYAHRKPRS
jgi:hypothetical protein